MIHGEWGGGGEESDIQQFGKASRRLNRLTQNLAHMCGVIWEWTLAKQTRPSIPIGGILGISWGRQIKYVNGGQTDGPIGTIFGIRMGIGLGMDTAKQNLPHETPEGVLGGALQNYGTRSMSVPVRPCSHCYSGTVIRHKFVPAKLCRHIGARSH